MKNVEIKSRIIASLYHCYRLRGNGKFYAFFHATILLRE